MAKHILVLSDGIGSGDEELGRLLMRNFLYAVARNAEKPQSVMLMHGAVRLACEDSAAVDHLRLLVDAGVAVRVCGTCLDYLGLKDRVEVGDVGNMVDSVASLLSDAEVLTIS
ncbi:MAG: sulfurtransferase-like selenium metabolism protein YedF [Coriobacteriia bacterium]|nr:sulfurtransferase-like selenium metabolism protein YedF [Coriobacteriia bacterium]